LIKQQNNYFYFMEKIENFYQLSDFDLFKLFGTTDKGYTSEKVAELLQKYGPNELEEEEKETIFQKVMEQFEDILVRILLVAAIISFVIALTGNGEEGFSAYVEPFVILLILIANAVIGVWQDINADKAIEALKKLQASTTNVYRDAKLVQIDSKDLVPGDIIFLKEGERIPADVRFIKIFTSTFTTNESLLTGEPRPAYKEVDVINKKELGLKEMYNIGFSSCGVSGGEAIAIVVKTGMNTEIGKIQTMVKESQEEEKKSPLKLKLEEFGEYLTYIIMGICVVVWIIAIAVIPLA
jgi:magnesium-transporting ATPase (P-type)